MRRPTGPLTTHSLTQACGRGGEGVDAGVLGELEALGDGGDGALVGGPRTTEAIIQSGIGLGRDWRRG